MKYLRQFITISRDIEVFVNGISGELYSLMKERYLTEEYLFSAQIKSDILSVLKKRGLEKKVLQSIHASIKLSEKDITQKETSKRLSSFTSPEGKSINILSLFTAESIADKLTERFRAVFKPFINRIKSINRLKRLSPTGEGIEKLERSINRTIQRFRTKIVGYDREIEVQEKILKESDSPTEKKVTENRLLKVRTNRAFYSDMSISLKRRLADYNRLLKKRPSPKAIKREYLSLIEFYKSLLISTEANLLFYEIFEKSLFSYIVTTMQNQLMLSIRDASLEKMKREFDRGKKVIVTIALSDLHNIYDICDIVAGEYVYPKLPKEGLPPYHLRCQCDIIIKIVSNE